MAQSISQVRAVCVWSGDRLLDLHQHDENQEDERGGIGNTSLRLVSCHRSGTWPALAGVYIIATSTDLDTGNASSHMQPARAFPRVHYSALYMHGLCAYVCHCSLAVSFSTIHKSSKPGLDVHDMYEYPVPGINIAEPPLLQHALRCRSG